MTSARTTNGEPVVVGVRDGRIRTVTPNSWEQVSANFEGSRQRATSVYARNNEAPVKTEASTKGGYRVNSVDRAPKRGAKIITKQALVNRYGKDFYQDDQPARGSYNPDTNTIRLLKDADTSTFLHESGHFFLTTLRDIAARPGALDNIRRDMTTLGEWYRGNAGDVAAEAAKYAGHDVTPDQVHEYLDKDTTDDAIRDAAIDRAQHEQFARGFEKYLFEGKAPTVELQSLFSQFRSWLLDVYQSISDLRVNLTPEVRGVFDRMLASDQAIADAEHAREQGVFPEYPTMPRWQACQAKPAKRRANKTAKPWRLKLRTQAETQNAFTGSAPMRHTMIQQRQNNALDVREPDYAQAAKQFNGSLPDLAKALNEDSKNNAYFVPIDNPTADSAQRIHDATGVDVAGGRAISYGSDVISDLREHPDLSADDWQQAASMINNFDKAGRSIAQRRMQGERITLTKDLGNGESHGAVFEVLNGRPGRRLVLKSFVRDKTGQVNSWFNSNTREKLDSGFMRAGGDSRFPNNAGEDANTDHPGIHDGSVNRDGEDFNQGARGSYHPETNTIRLLKDRRGQLHFLT